MKKENIKIDILCYLYPTAPFIKVETLKSCLKLLLTTDASSVLTITSYAYPILRSLKKIKDGELNYVWKKYADTRSQDLPEFFHDAGQCYFFDLRDVKNKEKRIGLSIPRIEAQDIDTLEDFDTAEKLFRIMQKDINKKK